MEELENTESWKKMVESVTVLLIDLIYRRGVVWTATSTSSIVTGRGGYNN